MKKCRKIIAVIIAMLMIFGVLPVNSAMAAAKNKVKSVLITNVPANVLKLEKGQQFTLKTKVQTTGKAGKEVKFSSSNKKVARVTADGKVTGVGKGKAEITAKSAVSPKVKYTISVNVSNRKSNLIKKLTVGEKNVTLTEGDTYKIDVRISPEKAAANKLSYSSSNKKVAKVSKNGTVTALAEGKAVITIESIPDTVIFEHCTFPIFNGGSATLRDCVVHPGTHLGINLHCYDCIFKVLEGSDNSFSLNFNAAADADRLFENCKFKGRTATNGIFFSGTFRNCEFDDFTMIASVRENVSDDSLVFENCKINSTAESFINVGPFAYGKGYVKLTLKDCDITHTGKRLINLMSKTNGNSQIIFDNCRVNKNDGNLVDGYLLNNWSDTESMDIIFRKGSINRTLPVDRNLNSGLIRIKYEE